MQVLPWVRARFIWADMLSLAVSSGSCKCIPGACASLGTLLKVLASNALSWRFPAFLYFTLPVDLSLGI